MPLLDPTAIVERATDRCPRGPWPEGAPPCELTRSIAAARTGKLAARAEMFLFHYEHRAPLDREDAEGSEEQAEPQWRDGEIAEPKYDGFRHDLRIGSFHPSHRAKWTAHELCHALVGFAWRADATPLFLATGARLAELAPVVLWYFLDEIGLARCPRHTGPLYRSWCPDCERIARAPPPDDPNLDRARSERLAGDAVRFVDEELAAIARTQALGVPVPHVHGSLDLCSDGLAYAASHGPRLRGRAFAMWFERFVDPADPAVHRTIADLEARVVDVLNAIGCGAPLHTPGTREGFVAQDLGQRLLEIWDRASGPCADDLIRIVDALASGGAPGDAHASYAALHEAYDLPHPADVFAVGYDLQDAPGRSVPRIADGLQTVVPLVLTAASDASTDLVPPFVAADGRAPHRAPLGVRFARWLAANHPGPVADLARYEVALRTVRADPEAEVLGTQGAGWRLARGAEAHAFDLDVVDLAERVDSGEVGGVQRDGRLGLTAGVEAGASEPESGAVVEAGPLVGLIVGRGGDGSLVIADVDPAPWVRAGVAVYAARADVAPGAEPSPSADLSSVLPEDQLLPLVELGLVVRATWRTT